MAAWVSAAPCARCDYTGAPLTPDDLIPLPEGATLSMLPERLAVGLDAQGERQT